jgi:hypothetical protein
LEGFFGTAHWVKDFLALDGHLLLLSLLNAPSIPYDFEETRDGLGLRGLMALLVDQNGQTIVPPLLAVLKEILGDITSNTATIPPDLIDTSSVDMQELNGLVRLYSRLSSHLAILQSIYNTTMNMQGRPSAPHTVAFSYPANSEIIPQIGKVIR